MGMNLERGSNVGRNHQVVGVDRREYSFAGVNAQFTLEISKCLVPPSSSPSKIDPHSNTFTHNSEQVVSNLLAVGLQHLLLFVMYSPDTMSEIEMNHDLKAIPHSALGFRSPSEIMSVHQGKGALRNHRESGERQISTKHAAFVTSPQRLRDDRKSGKLRQQLQNHPTKFFDVTHNLINLLVFIIGLLDDCH